MKTLKKWILLACILLASFAIYALVSNTNKKPFQKRPFQDLKPEDIVSVTAQLIPPDKTIGVTEIDKLTGYLNDVVIYRKDNSYSEYAGQAVVFTLSMADGTQTKVMEYNPFLVIDGIGYRTKYEPCEALNQFANSLLEKEDENWHFLYP